MNGVGDINVTTLIGYTSFNDESGESQDRLVTFKRWLWAVIEKMAPLEKQVILKVIVKHVVNILLLTVTH